MGQNRRKKRGRGFVTFKRGEVSVETWTQILYNNTLFMLRYPSTQ